MLMGKLGMAVFGWKRTACIRCDFLMHAVKAALPIKGPMMQRWLFFALVLLLGVGQGVAAQDTPGLALTHQAVIEAVPARDQLGVGPVAALSPDGTYLAMRNQETRSLELWDTATGERLGQLPVGPAALTFSPDGKRLAVIAPNLIVFNVDILAQAGELTEEAMLQLLESGLVHVVLPATRNEFGDKVASLVFTPDGNVLMTVSVLPSMMWAWDVGEAMTIEELESSGPPAERASVAVELGDPLHIDPYSIHTGSDGIYALTHESQGDETAYFVTQITPDPLTGGVGQGTSGPVARVEDGWPIMSSQSHDVLISTTEEMHFFSANGDADRPLSRPLTDRVIVALSPDGKVAAAVNPRAPTMVEYLDTATGDVLATSAVTGRLMSAGVLFSPDGSTVAIVTNQGVEIWTLGAPSR